MADSLGQVFPGTTFLTDRARTEGLTGSAIPIAPLAATPGQRSASDKLVANVFRLLLAHPDDRVVAIDDVELVNLSTSGIDAIVSMVRDSVARVLAAPEWAGDAAQLAVAARERASFHLLSPMVESYFLASPAATGAALEGRAPTAPNRFDPASRDAEWFEVDDRDYLQPADLEPAFREKSWAHPDRKRHPKRYLQFLGAPHDPRSPWYRPSQHGAAAIRALDWGGVLGDPLHGRLARSLFVDLAAGLGVPAPFEGEPHPATWGAATVFRNL